MSQHNISYDISSFPSNIYHHFWLGKFRWPHEWGVSVAEAIHSSILIQYTLVAHIFKIFSNYISPSFDFSSSLLMPSPYLPTAEPIVIYVHSDLFRLWAYHLMEKMLPATGILNKLILVTVDAPSTSTFQIHACKDSLQAVSLLSILFRAITLSHFILKNRFFAKTAIYLFI